MDAGIRMSRRDLLKSTAGGVFSNYFALGGSSAGREKKPNIVVCLCDQLRSFELGCYGNPVIQTPNIDKLAEGGCRFDVAVTNNPVCVPSRSSLLSGQYSRTCVGELWNDASDTPSVKRTRFPQQSLAEVLNEAGYRTALIGKWHIELDPFLMGFEYALYPVYVQYGERNYGWLYRENSRDRARFSTEGARELLPQDEFDPAFTSSRMREYIARHKSQPFFLYYNILQPHMPIGPGNMPDKYAKMYDRKDVPLRKNVYKDGVMAHDEYWFKVYTIWDYWGRHFLNQNANRKEDRLPQGFDLRDLTAYYYGAITCVDDLLGELMRTLEENGIADNTIVVLAADHGDMLGSHHLYNKGYLWEESIRVPLIFRYPRGVNPSVNRTQVASIIDVMPTVLDVCGLPVPKLVQGQSLLPLLRQERESLDKDFQMIETAGFHIGVRTPSHMYGMELDKVKPLNVADDRLYFFDLTDDPFELNNLAGTEEQSHLAEELRQRLTRWNKSTPWLEL
jgi:arylsulfatase A-like enzyme